MTSFSGNPNGQQFSFSTATLSKIPNPTAPITHTHTHPHPQLLSSSPLPHDSTVTTVLPASESSVPFAPSTFSSSLPFPFSHFLPPLLSAPFLASHHFTFLPPSSSHFVSSPPLSSSSTFSIPPPIHGYNSFPSSSSVFSPSPFVITQLVPLLSSLNQANPVKLNGDNFLT